ncbi:protein kinase, partial [Candidatus Woesearchaeota archaeon]|nr:protein kinase [Candidatus Woesearchaeota archaeon]
NIMINRRGYAVLTDLGILSLSSDEENGYMNSAKILTQFTKLTKKGEVIGSIGFMPPEQATGKEVDARSDLYSLGATLYSLLTHNRCHYMGVRNAESIQDAYFTFLRAIGELPDKDGKKRVLDITKPREYNPSIPEELEKVLIKALQVDKNKRFQNAEEFLSALENFR